VEKVAEFEVLVRSEEALMLYFFSNQCVTCMSLRPKIQELVAARFTKMLMQLIDAQANPSIAAHFGVFSTPTILVFFNGHEHFRVSRFVSLPQLEATIERPYHLLFD
jgi:thioredoxin 1